MDTVKEQEVYQAVLDHTSENKAVNSMLIDTSVIDVTGSLGVWGIEEVDSIY